MKKEEENKINNQDKSNNAKSSDNHSGVGIFTRHDPIESKIAAEVNQQQNINNKGTSKPNK